MCLAIAINVSAVEFVDYRLGVLNFTITSGKGICKVKDTQTYFYASSGGGGGTEKRYLPNGTYDADIRSPLDTGDSYFACNSTYILSGESDTDLIRTLDHAGNDQTKNITFASELDGDICMTPNSTYLYSVARQAGALRGTVFRYRLDTLAYDNFNFSVNNQLGNAYGLTCSEDIIYVANLSMIVEFDHAGNYIGNFSLEPFFGLGIGPIYLGINDSSLFALVTETVPYSVISLDRIDLIPPEMLSCNVTSEGGEGQQVNWSDKQCLGTGCIVPKTNDTTFTIKCITTEDANCAIIDLNRDLNYSDIIAGAPECSTTGAKIHTCTLPTANKTGIGLHNFSLGCNDGNENSTSTSGKILINITSGTTLTVYLDGVNDSSKYEFPITRSGTVVARVVNITIEVNGSGTTCLTIEDQINLSCQTDNIWSYYFNITSTVIEFFSNNLRRINLTTGNDYAALLMDNSTDIIEFIVNATGYGIGGYPENVEIDVDQDGKKEILMPGQLRGKKIITDTFLADNAKRINYNVSFLSGGSATINTNTSTVSGIINLTFLISGYELDEENEFDYTEHYNGTDGSKPFNETLSFHSDAPLGIFDDFTANNSIWSYTQTKGSAPPKLSYTDTSGKLRYEQSAATEASTTIESIMTYSDAAGDFRNSSKIEFLFDYLLSISTCSPPLTGGRNAFLSIRVTDGTSNVILKSYELASATDSGGTQSASLNYTLINKDYTNDRTWQLFINGGGGEIKDFSSLDFTKQIKLQVLGRVADFCGGGTSSRVDLDKISWSGIWLNRSTNNGTYKSDGNSTQCVQSTPEDVSRTLIEVSDNKPAGTDIEYYLTNEGGNTNPTFERTIPGVIHTYSTTGNSICVRPVLSSTVNTSSPVVRKMRISVTQGSLENISVDFGCDGDSDWELLEVLNSSNSPKFVNGSMNDLVNYFTNNCVGDLVCDYPVCVTSITGGTIEIANVSSVVQAINMDLNVTKAVSKTKINMSVIFTNGVVELSGLNLDFKGHKNYTANVTLYSKGIMSTVSHIIQVIYSKFNRTLPYTFTTTIIPYNGLNSVNSTNITPFGQTILIPILNFTGEAKESFSIGMSLNQTLSCLQSEIRNNSNTSLVGINMTSTISTILNLTSPIGSKGAWAWFHLYDCNATDLRYIRLKYNEESCCSECSPCWD